MTHPAYAIVFSALVSGVSGGGSPGDVLIVNTGGTAFVNATTANRGTRRSTGIALTSYVNGGTVEIQQFGQVAPTLVPSLGAGAASWVRVSATGQLERCTPSGADDVCGYVETDGTFHACFGFLTAASVNGSATTAAVPIAALAIDWSLGGVFTKTLAAGANAFTFSNQASGMIIVVRVTGAASTVTWPTVKWAGGAAPTQTASGTDIYTFVHDGTSIYGSVVQAMA